MARNFNEVAAERAELLKQIDSLEKTKESLNPTMTSTIESYDVQIRDLEDRVKELRIPSGVSYMDPVIEPLTKEQFKYIKEESKLSIPTLRLMESIKNKADDFITKHGKLKERGSWIFDGKDFKKELTKEEKKVFSRLTRTRSVNESINLIKKTLLPGTAFSKRDPKLIAPRIAQDIKRADKDNSIRKAIIAQNPELKGSELDKVVDARYHDIAGRVSELARVAGEEQFIVASEVGSGALIGLAHAARYLGPKVAKVVGKAVQKYAPKAAQPFKAAFNKVAYTSPLRPSTTTIPEGPLVAGQSYAAPGTARTARSAGHPFERGAVPEADIAPPISSATVQPDSRVAEAVASSGRGHWKSPPASAEAIKRADEVPLPVSTDALEEAAIRGAGGQWTPAAGRADSTGWAVQPRTLAEETATVAGPMLPRTSGVVTTAEREAAKRAAATPTVSGEAQALRNLRIRTGQPHFVPSRPPPPSPTVSQTLGPVRNVAAAMPIRAAMAEMLGFETFEGMSSADKYALIDATERAKQKISSDSEIISSDEFPEDILARTGTFVDREDIPISEEQIAEPGFGRMLGLRRSGKEIERDVAITEALDAGDYDRVAALEKQYGSSDWKESLTQRTKDYTPEQIEAMLSPDVSGSPLDELQGLLGDVEPVNEDSEYMSLMNKGGRVKPKKKKKTKKSSKTFKSYSNKTRKPSRA